MLARLENFAQAIPEYQVDFFMSWVTIVWLVCVAVLYLGPTNRSK
jgi:hypothetical protein